MNDSERKDVGETEPTAPAAQPADTGDVDTGGVEATATDRPETAEPETDMGVDAGWDAGDFAEGLQTAGLQAEVDTLRGENAKMKDQLLRALADAENTRRRAERDKQDTTKYAVSKFAKDILDVGDNLDRALEHVPAEAREADTTLKTLVEGIEATQRLLRDMLERHGLSRIDPAGEPFDPNYHQAMFEVPNSGQMPGTVVQVMQVGYALHGRLLRPAMVGVAKGEPPQKVDTSA